MMPNLVCTTCQRGLKTSTVGVTLIEMASFGPYKVWQADTQKCPEYGIEVVAGFGNQPIMQHFEDGFEEKLEALKRQAVRVIYNYER